MIECRYGKLNRLFINHLGELIPCCYLNSESLNMAAGNSPKTLFGEFNEKYDNSLYNKSIEEIINGPMFNGIMTSWETSQPVKKCKEKCEFKDRDKFIDNFHEKEK